MPAPTKIYFTQLSVGWTDWVEAVNVSQENANILAVARDQNGQTVWSQTATLRPFQGFVTAADSVKVPASMIISSDKPILGERFCTSQSRVLHFPGASPESMTIGRRLFFPEVYAGGTDWFRILNVSDNQTNVNVIQRNTTGQIQRQFSRNINPLSWWEFTDKDIGNINGTLEILSTHPVLGERHLVYTKILQGVSVGQLGQVLDRPTTKLYFPELSEVWNDWLRVVNVSNEKAKVTALARDANGKAVWSEEAEVSPFYTWNPKVEAIKGNTSVTVTSDKHIVAERHDHRALEVLCFPGASLEARTVGRRLFFPEIYSGGLDWFRFMNVDQAACRISVVVRDRQGDIKRQLNSPGIPPMGYWIVHDTQLGNLTGTLEALCTQLTVGEQHLHYELNSKQVAAGSFGQVMD